MAPAPVTGCPRLEAIHLARILREGQKSANIHAN
jgi:hypothetical protein